MVSKTSLRREAIEVDSINIAPVPSPCFFRPLAQKPLSVLAQNLH